MKTTKVILGFLVLASISAANAANAANNAKIAYMDAPSIEAQNSAIVQTNIAKLSELALVKIQEMMPACGFPAGNEARIEQLSNLKKTDVQYLGSATLVRNNELEPEIKTPRFISIEMYYKIPAAHGAEDLIVGVGFKTQNLVGVQANVMIDAKDESSAQIEIFRVPMMDSKNVVKIEGLQAMTPRADCALSADLVQKLIQQ